MFPITQSGYAKLQKKMEVMKKEFEKMPAIIAHAREKGDLKENAEYHAAREKQGLLNAQIQKMNSDIQNSKIIDPKLLSPDLVTFGKWIEITNQSNQQKSVHQLLGPAECVFEEKSISITSLLGKGLLGRKTGESFSIEVPSGVKHYQINRIWI